MIDVQALSMRYADGHQALHNISFHIGEGQKVALLGANGAGKSTLLLTLLGLLPAQEGLISVGGLELNKQNIAAIRALAGLLMQNPDDQLFSARVYDDVAFGPRNLRLDEAQVERRVTDTLNELRIAHLRDKIPYQLSAGEKRSVALAGLLAMRPRALLLDEPCSFLDPRARRMLIAELQKLPQTMLIATHDLELAATCCDSAMLLYQGRLAAFAPAAQVLGDQRLLEEHGL